MRRSIFCALCTISLVMFSPHPAFSQWTAVITGAETQRPWCPKPGLCGNYWVTGSVSISANGSTVTADYQQGSTVSSLASALCSRMTSSFPVQCTGTSGGTINISDPGNFLLSGSSGVDFPPPTNKPAFTISFPPASGFVNPKYVIVGVTYAPPGSQSSVTYQQTKNLGSATALSGYWQNMSATSVAVS